MLYPDSGSPYEDAAILRNAVYFSTAQRAYSADLVLKQAMGIDQRELAFLTLRSFEEFMTSTEDLLAWLFALQEWRPGTPEYSLFILLDRIQVGRTDKKRGIDYSEERAVNILKGCDVEKFRNLVHIPSREDMLAYGRMGDGVTENIERSMKFKLDGWLRIAERRAEQNRGWVRAFSKVKHHMFAFPTRERAKEEIWLPTRIRLDLTHNRIGLEKAWLTVSADEVRTKTGDALAAQAILHDTLALVMLTRYALQYDPPSWLVNAFNTEYIWRKKPLS